MNPSLARCSTVKSPPSPTRPSSSKTARCRLLAPMSEIAGRLSIQVGAWCLQAENGGRGILLGGASGVRPANVVILGAGMSGTAACQVAAGMGAYVSILDINPTKLRYVHDILGGHVTTLMSNRANVEEAVVDADLVIGSVLIPGAQAPKIIPRALGQTDEARRGVRRHLHRSRRLRRNFAADDSSQSDLRRGRIWSIIASPTCRPSCPTPRPMRSPIRLCPTASSSPTGVFPRRSSETKRWPKASILSTAKSPTRVSPTR